MTSQEDFYLLEFKTNFLIKLVDIKLNNIKKYSWFDDFTKEEIIKLQDKVKNIDYEKINQNLVKSSFNFKKLKNLNLK